VTPWMMVGYSARFRLQQGQIGDPIGVPVPRWCR